MAQEGGKPTFSEVAPSRGGGLYSAAFFGANAFSGGDEEGGYSSAGSKKMRDVLTYAEYLDSKERSDWQQKHQARLDAHRIEMEKMAERRAELEIERANRAEKLALQNEEMDNKAGELGAKLYQLDPNRPDYIEKKRELLSDPENHRALNSKFGLRVLETMKEQDARHDNMKSWFTSRAQETGYDKDFYDPSHRTSSGDLDFRGLDQRFAESAQALSQRKMEEQQKREQELTAQGMVPKRVSFDPETGKEKREYVLKAQTGVREIMAEGRALKEEFQSNFGGVKPDVLNYSVGYKDPRGYTLKRGSVKENGKFVEDPAGNAVKIHDALHPKDDKVVGLDTFQQFKFAYSQHNKRIQEHRETYPGLLDEEASKQAEVEPKKKPSAEGKVEPTTAAERLKQKRQSEAESKAIDSKINDLQKNIQKRKDYIANPPALASKADVEDMQAKVQDLESELEGLKGQKEQTTPLSEQGGSTTDELFPPKQ